MVTGKADGQEDPKVMVAGSTKGEPDELSYPSSKGIDDGSDATTILASQVRVQTGIGSCPKCGGKLFEERDQKNAWHYCERENVQGTRPGAQSGRRCDYKIFCRDPNRCVLGSVVTAPVLMPCRYGHEGTWVFRERRGRLYLLVCCGPGQGHRTYCGQIRRHWRGAKPTFERRPTDNPDGYTVFCCLKVLNELETATVSDVAGHSGLSERQARACLKRMSLAAVPLVKELVEKGFAPWIRRYVLQYALTREGAITIAYESQYGPYADAPSPVEPTEA